jgi:hypothetical protein
MDTTENATEIESLIKLNDSTQLSALEHTSV